MKFGAQAGGLGVETTGAIEAARIEAIYIRFAEATERR